MRPTGGGGGGGGGGGTGSTPPYPPSISPLPHLFHYPNSLPISPTHQSISPTPSIAPLPILISPTPSISPASYSAQRGSKLPPIKFSPSPFHPTSHWFGIINSPLKANSHLKTFATSKLSL